MDSLGSVIYAARLADGTIKIGHTDHFGERLKELKSYTRQDVELLAFRFGSYEEEQAIHAQLAPYRVRLTKFAREYYRPVAPVMEVVNTMRGELGMSAA